MTEKLKYWLLQRGKNCRHCCLACEYYDLCSWEVKNEADISKAAISLGRSNGKYGLLMHIYKYLIFRQTRKGGKNEKRKDRQRGRSTRDAF